MDKVINLRISAELLEQLDHERGLIPRSAYIRDLVEKALGQSDKPAIKQPKPKATNPAVKGANQRRALEIQEKLAQLGELPKTERHQIIEHQYPKSEVFKALNGTVSKDSIAKYWDEIVLPLLKRD